MFEEHKRLESEAMAEYLAAKDRPEHERTALWAKFIEIHKNRTTEQVFIDEANKGLL